MVVDGGRAIYTETTEDVFLKIVSNSVFLFIDWLPPEGTWTLLIFYLSQNKMNETALTEN